MGAPGCVYLLVFHGVFDSSVYVCESVSLHSSLVVLIRLLRGWYVLIIK